MSKKKTQVHWVNPSNPYHEAKFEAWLKYTEAYHSYAGIPEQQKLYKQMVATKRRRVFNDTDGRMSIPLALSGNMNYFIKTKKKN